MPLLYSHNTPNTFSKSIPYTEKTTFLMGNGPLLGHNKWYGGLVSPIDDAIYGINQNAKSIDALTPEPNVLLSTAIFPKASTNGMVV
jgi:hypothetical protein